MGKTLFGGESSGTPVETRGATTDVARLIQQMMQTGPEGVAEPFGRMTSDAWINMLGFDPAMMGMDEAVMGALRDPADATQGLFASLEPFEARQTEQQVGGQRSMFGAVGGRFGRNLGDAEAMLRGELAGNFMRTREQSLLAANEQRNAALANIMAAALGARGQAFQESFAPWQSALQFLQPGAPIIKEGLAPGIIGAGLNLYGMLKLMQRRPGDTPTTTAGGIPLDTRGGGVGFGSYGFSPGTPWRR